MAQAMITTQALEQVTETVPLSTIPIEATSQQLANPKEEI